MKPDGWRRLQRRVELGEVQNEADSLSHIHREVGHFQGFHQAAIDLNNFQRHAVYRHSEHGEGCLVNHSHTRIR